MITRAVLVAVALLAATAPAAHAHATVVRTFPADTAVVRDAPAQVRMRFSEPVELGPGSLRLLDASGREIETPAPRHGDAATAILDLPRETRDGTYVVAWRVTSADSHPVSGAFSFSVGKPSSLVIAGAPGAAGGAVRLADGIARAVAFLGLALAVGGACVLLMLWPEGPRSARGRLVFSAGVIALAAGTVALLILQGPYASGGRLTDLSLLSFSVSTRFGQALIIRLVLTFAFAALVARALRAPSRGVLVAAGACAVGLVATWTLTDHSRTGVQTWLGVPAASAHLLAMTLWFGGLTLLLVCVLARDVHVSLEPVMPRFSRLALACFAVLGATGLYLAWRQSGALAALPGTEFGRLLLIKSAVVLVIIGLAALSRRAVQRGGGDLARRLRRTVAAEAVLGVVVLGVTATLVNAAPARVSYAPPLDVTVPGPDGGRVQVHVEPAKQGSNVADVFLVGRAGRLLVPPEVSARLLAPAGEDLAPLPVTLGNAEPGHYVATNLAVPFPGRWKLRLQVRTSDIDEDVIDVPLRIPMRLAALLVLVLVLAEPASAHVTVIPDRARPGQTVELTFRVPNERDDAATTRVDLFLPPGVPAKVAEQPGWTTADLGTGEVRWIAEAPGALIGPGRSRDFKVTLGPLPRTDRIAFKALQHYADGRVVRWIQTSGPSDERPAAILNLSGRRAAGGGSSPALWLIPLAMLLLVGAALVVRSRR